MLNGQLMNMAASMQAVDALTVVHTGSPNAMSAIMTSVSQSVSMKTN